MAMEWTSLELKLRSCKHLKTFNFFNKLSVYVVVFMFKDDGKKNKEEKRQRLQRQKTPVDKEGHRNPEWNHPMSFDLVSVLGTDNDTSNLFLKFKLRCDAGVLGRRTIGEVCVPFRDLINDFNGTVRYVSYQVKNSDGKANGVLDFSYKVTGNSNNIETGPVVVNDQSLEVNVLPKGNCMYPPLDDILSPLPKVIVPPPTVHYPVSLQSHSMPPPSPTMSHGMYYNYYPSPLMQSPRPYRYPTETFSGTLPGQHQVWAV